MVTTNMLILKSISSIVIPIIIILIIVKIFTNKKKEDISTSTEKSGFGVKKIALISIPAIIVVAVIITIINSSHSTFKTATNSKVDIETNNSIANNKEKEYYDFIDTNDFTLKLTEQETLALVAKTFGKNISQFEKASDSTSTEKFYSLDFYGGSIVVKMDLVNNKTKKLTFTYISFTKLNNDELASKKIIYMSGLLSVVSNNSDPEYIKNLNLELKLDTNVKGLHPRLEYSSEYGFSMSIEVEK